MKSFTKLSVIIPTYNEGKTLLTVLENIYSVKLAEAIGIEIIIVDDCSNDHTEALIKTYQNSNPDRSVFYYKHQHNLGKGAAIHTGLKVASGEYLMIQDADLEYNPQEYNLLLKPIIDGHADVVYGSRFIGGNAHRILFFWHTIGNKFLTFLSNLFSNLNLTDMETCYKVFNTKIIQDLKLKEQRFGFEPEVTAKIAKVPNIRIYEVGISYYGRTYEEGKKINWKDGLMAIYYIIKYNLGR